MENRHLNLWADKPAQSWEEEAFPIGNGRLGAMVFGGVLRETIQFNEETLFSGRPVTADKTAHQKLGKIRELLKQGRYQEAQEFTNKDFLKQGAYGVQNDFGLYQNFGEMLIEYDNQKEDITEYRRELDITDAVASVSYTCGERHYRKEYLSSYPADVIAIRIECDRMGQVSLRVSAIPGQEHAKTAAAGDEITLAGTTGYLEYEARIKVLCDNGIMRVSDGYICVENADSVTLLLTASTAYLADYPSYKGNDFLRHNRNVLECAEAGGWQGIKTEHVADYRKLFGRVELQLGRTDMDAEEETTAMRLKEYQNGRTDYGLEALLFQYGRYLLISSSRPGTLPANLQGIWNNSNDPMWGSMFCYNINLNMNYWPAELTNLRECHMPLVEFVDGLRESGRESAKAYFDAGGWFASKKSDIWGYTQPYAEAVYGLFIGGAGWLCQDIWEYYSFNKDLDYLRGTAYPIMKECAEFYLDYLTENEDGLLVSSPSASPENTFYVDGQGATVSDGCEMDHRIIEEVFGNCIKCCEILGIDPEFKELLQTKKKKLAPTKTGENGEILEWYHDWDYPERRHRHMSMMYGFHPGQLHSPGENPALTMAARKTMDSRGDEGTGWSRAWKINLWARLLDGNRSYQVLHNMIKRCFCRNLFALHPPFQIDGNLGYVSGLAELLLQSTFDGEIKLLPALPDIWEEGSVTGLRARGDFTVDITWREGKLESAVLHGKPGDTGEVSYRGKKEKFIIGGEGCIKVDEGGVKA